MKMPCSKYSQEFDKLQSNLEVRKVYARFSSVFEYIEIHTNLEMGKNTVQSTQLLYDSLFVEVKYYIQIYAFVCFSICVSVLKNKRGATI